jgi:hypothetical protein
MLTTNIYTFGDGFATGHLWPEWPQILQALLPDYNVINIAGIGAGNEFIYSNVIDTVRHDPDAIFLVQWAMPKRFDKIIEDSSWDAIIGSDLTYSDNLTIVNDQTWWLTSASTVPEIQQYHQYIQTKQSNLRSFNYIWSAGKLLKHHCFFGTYNFDYLTPDQKKDCNEFNWMWHRPWFGLESFSKLPEFSTTRQNEIQPSPVVHLEWIKQVLLPNRLFKIDQKRLDLLSKNIYNQQWIPYDPERDEIWNNLRKI